ADQLSEALGVLLPEHSRSVALRIAIALPLAALAVSACWLAVSHFLDGRPAALEPASRRQTPGRLLDLISLLLLPVVVVTLMLSWHFVQRWGGGRWGRERRCATFGPALLGL